MKTFTNISYDKTGLALIPLRDAEEALEEQAKLFMSCLPVTADCHELVNDYENGMIEGHNTCRSEFLSNAEKLGLINKK